MELAHFYIAIVTGQYLQRLDMVSAPHTNGAIITSSGKIEPKRAKFYDMDNRK